MIPGDKVLTIKQPWAWAIVHAGKRIENRPWRTDYRGTLFIHASQRRSHRRADDVRLVSILSDLDGPRLPSRDELIYSAIIGRCQLVDCVPIDEVSSNPWAFGPWCWILENVEAIEPFACPGQLSLWPAPRGLAA
jgi:hypothetical protein